VGRRIRTLRWAKGLSQRELAERAGVGSRTVANVEAGEGMTVATLAALAGVLGASADDLLNPRRSVRQ